jgi:hypothetical protein
VQGWPFGEVTVEAYDTDDWRSTGNFVALDVDVPGGHAAALRARGLMRGQDEPVWGGVVVALLVAADFAAGPGSELVEGVTGMADTVVLLRIPAGRLPLRSAAAGYSRSGAPYSRTKAACSSREAWLVGWAHKGAPAHGAWEIS